MTRLRRFLGAVGILLLAIFGTFGLLTGPADPGGLAMLCLAAIGLILWVQALALGDMKRPRQFLGAVGLLMVAISLPLTLLALITDPGAAPSLVIWVGVGLALWSQAVAAQAGLPYRVTVGWLMVVCGLVLGFVIIVGLISAGLGLVLGTGVRRPEGYFARGVIIAIITALGVAWARRDPRRATALQALGRAALGRATAEDSRLLAGGPRVLLAGS